MPGETSKPKRTVITVEKLDAARRQLHTAIWLWFHGGDPVAIHALAFAAHEIVHTRFKLKGLRGLLFDSRHVPEGKRREFGAAASKAGTFFKHARHDPHGKLRFVPEQSEPLMMAAVLGLWKMGERIHMTEGLLMLWLRAHRPDWFPISAAQIAATAEASADLRKMDKSHFFERHALAWKSGALDEGINFLHEKFAPTPNS